jgi:hypothetical protein
MTENERLQLKRNIKNVFRTPEWRRIKLIIKGQEHDADRETIVRDVRRILTADMTGFRGRELGRPMADEDAASPSGKP